MLEIIITCLCILMGVYWALTGLLKLDFWSESGGPGGGFIPLAVGVFVVIMGIYSLVKGRKKIKDEKVRLECKSFLPAAAVLAAILLTYVTGMIPAAFLLILLWLVLIEKTRIPKAFCISALFMAAVWFVFSWWLKVPFPTGIFFA